MPSLLNELTARSNTIRNEALRLASTKQSPPSTQQIGLAPSRGSEMPQRSSEIQDAKDQYEHNRGRVFSAIRVAARRIAGQQVFVTRDQPRDNSRTVQSYLHKGLLHELQLPTWEKQTQLREMELLDEHPLLDRLGNPNRFMTRSMLWDMTVYSLLITGRAPWLAAQEEGDTPSLLPLPATWAKPIHGNGRVFDRWKIRPPGAEGEGIEVPDEMVAQPYFADPSNPLAAISPLQQIARAVLADEAIATAQHAQFNNNGFPGHALIAGDATSEASLSSGVDEAGTTRARPVALEPHQRRQIVDWFRREYQGVQKFGLPMVLDAVIRDIKPLSRTNQEMAFRDSSQITKDQIFEGFGIPQVSAGNIEDANRATAAVADSVLCLNVLNPIVQLLSETLTKKVAPLFASDNENLTVWIEPCSTVDPELELEWWNLGRRGYAVTRNDIRKKLGLAPKEGWDDVVAPDRVREIDEEDRINVIPRSNERSLILGGSQNGNGNGHL